MRTRRRPSVPLPMVAVPLVEFANIADRLPELHPGLLASAIFAALLAMLALWAYRSKNPL